MVIDTRIEPPASRERPGADTQQESTELPEADRKIGQTIAYMLQHLNKRLQVGELASMASVSPSHFFALFKRRTGCAPIDFFIRLRMQHACQLLDSTSLNVKEIAAVLGYEDPFYFSRAFKAVNRVSPSEYRMMPGDRKRAFLNPPLPSTFLRNMQSNTGAANDSSSAAPDRRADGSPTRTATNSLSELRPNTESNGSILRGRPRRIDSGKEHFGQAKRNGSEVCKS